MIGEESIVLERFSALLSWEKAKRRERILASTLCYSLLASFVVLPFREWLHSWFGFLSLPLLFSLLLAPGFFLLQRWGRRDSLRALSLLDKTLHLEERAITAWEILGRGERRAAELWVLKEAAERLRGLDPKALFGRRWSWHAFSVPPLLLLWFLFAWHGGTAHLDREGEKKGPDSLAQKVQEYSRELKERARSQGLTRSLEAANSLEEAVKKSLAGGPKENGLKGALEGAMQRIGEMGSEVSAEADRRFSAATREELLDLRAEAETLRDALARSRSFNREEWMGKELAERLEALPRLREEIESSLLLKEKEWVKGLSGFLDRLEEGIVAELDRRTLFETREFLALMLRRGENGGEGEGPLFRPDRDKLLLFPSVLTRGDDKGSLPGTEPGKKDHPSQSAPPLREGLATQLKGRWGKGGSSSLMFRSESLGKKSEVPQEEVLTRYRRRAEEELASEPIPEGLKETVRRYFLSLEESGPKGE